MAFQDYANFLFAPTSKYYSDMVQNWEFVDSIDFLPYIREAAKKPYGIDIYELRSRIEDDYKDIKKPKCCQGFVFNHIDGRELAEYLQRRYEGKVYTKEEISYKCYWVEFDDSHDEKPPLPDNPPPAPIKKRGNSYDF